MISMKMGTQVSKFSESKVLYCWNQMKWPLLNCNLVTPKVNDISVSQDEGGNVPELALDSLVQEGER